MARLIRESGFQLSVEINFVFHLILHCCALHHFLNQLEVKAKKLMQLDLLACICPHLAWCQLPLFALHSDWFIGLSVSVMIGQCYYFGLAFRWFYVHFLIIYNCNLSSHIFIFIHFKIVT